MFHTAKQKTHSHRALGIDPGLAATGFALIGSLKQGGELCSFGTITTASRQSTQKRLQKIYLAVSELLASWQPDIMVIEDVFVQNKFPNAAIQLGEVRGIMYLAAQQQGIELLKIRPTEIKSCLTGNGRATKRQVALTVKRMLNRRDDITPDHASDAAALALIALSRKGFLTY